MNCVVKIYIYKQTFKAESQKFFDPDLAKPES